MSWKLGYLSAIFAFFFYFNVEKDRELTIRPESKEPTQDLL